MLNKLVQDPMKVTIETIFGLYWSALGQKVKEEMKF